MIGLQRIVVIAVAMVVASLAAGYLTPRAATHAKGVPLAQLVPAQFGEWRELEAPAVAVDPRTQRPGETDPEAPYDDVIMRSYTNARGEVVMLALAYGRHQRQEVKIHRPELCYIAQGYTVQGKASVSIALPARTPVNGARMLVNSPGRSEAVSYWIRIGDLYSSNAWKTRAHIFSEGLQGRVVDGMLVRVSQVVTGDGTVVARYESQEKFLGDLVSALSEEGRRLLLGGATS